MLIFCIILWIVFFYEARKIKKYESDPERSEFAKRMKPLRKWLLIILAPLTIVALLTSSKPNPNYDEFKQNVHEVMILNKPVVFKSKVNHKTVKIYFNEYTWKEMSHSERIEAKQRLENVVYTIGINSGYITENEKLNVIFYNDK